MRRLAESVEGENTSLAQSVTELWCCKLGQKRGRGGTKNCYHQSQKPTSAHSRTDEVSILWMGHRSIVPRN